MTRVFDEQAHKATAAVRSVVAANPAVSHGATVIVTTTGLQTWPTQGGVHAKWCNIVTPLPNQMVVQEVGDGGSINWERLVVSAQDVPANIRPSEKIRLTVHLNGAVDIKNIERVPA
jgi:hypothetical protein